MKEFFNLQMDSPIFALMACNSIISLAFPIGSFVTVPNERIIAYARWVVLTVSS